MCGIAGLAYTTGDGPAAAAGQSVLDLLSRRGPDARREWREGPCALYHCRLRVLDTSERADQPLERTGAERVVMVYNGEVYNYRGLRDELELSGWSFTTSSDAEVLLAGYLNWGESVLSRARGMWAVAFWHPARRRLVLARDPLGKKPLVYWSGAGRIAFASTIGALRPLLPSTPTIDRDALDCYLAHLSVPFEHCMLAGVSKVPPAGIVTWEDGKVSSERRYWSLPDGPLQRVPMAEASVQVEHLLRQAVRRRLVSDVPLGIFLSAGYDSGLIGAIAAQEAGQSLVAVCAGSAGSPNDERTDARQVAARYGLDFRPLEVEPASAASLPLLLAELGEPFGDSSLLPSFEVARHARQHMTVALTGDGGDEGFFGYEMFRGVRYAQIYRALVPDAVRNALWALTRGVTANGPLRRAAALFEYGSAPLATRYRNRMGFAAPDRERILQAAPPPSGHVGEHVYRERLSRWESLPDAEALRRTWFETVLPNDYLVKVDTATMASSLEARSPFLDLDLVEFVLSLDPSVAFPHGRRKALLQPLAQRLLPPAIRARRKTGFGVPLAAWMRGPLQPALEEFVFRRESGLDGLIKRAAVRVLLDAHLRGADHATRLWGILSLGVWLDTVVEGRWDPAVPMPIAVGR